MRCDGKSSLQPRRLWLMMGVFVGRVFVIKNLSIGYSAGNVQILIYGGLKSDCWRLKSDLCVCDYLTCSYDCDTTCPAVANRKKRTNT
jgi:hypothetical protein